MEMAGDSPSMMWNLRLRGASGSYEVGLVHAAEELVCVGGEALDIAALALGEDGVEGEEPATLSSIRWRLW
jgi:hypothetical protein